MKIEELKNLATKISSGLTPLRSNPNFWDSRDIPWVKTEQLGVKNIYDANEYISKEALDGTTIKLNPINTISVAMYGEGKTRGSVSILKKQMTTNQACCNIVINEDLADHEYVYYFLKTQYQNLRNLSSGVRKNLNSNDIKSYKINLPESLSEQKKIANVLSALDEKIELNKRINAELEAMAKLIYDYWFVQFDFPNEEGKPYKSSGGAMVYNEVLKRGIPVGWKDGQFGEYAKVSSGFAFKSSWWQESGIPVLKIKDINEDYTLNLSDLSFVDEKNTQKAEKYRSKKGDLVIAMTGATIGKFGVIPETEKPIFINQRVGLYKLGDKPLEKIPFLINSMRQDFFRQKIFQVAGGAAQPNISGEQLDKLPIIKPNSEILDKYNQMQKPVYEKILSNIQANQELSNLRDWLLPMLMNGQVQVG